MAFAPVFRRPFPATFDRRAAVAVPILHVQSALSGSLNTSDTFAFPSANTAGNLLIVGAKWSRNPASLIISDSNGNTYQPIQENAGVGGNKYSLYYVENCAAGANTISVTWSDDPLGGYIAIHEYSGVAPVNAYDKTKTASVSGTSIDTGFTSNVAQANELVWAWMTTNAILGTFINDPSYTNRTSNTNVMITGDKLSTAITGYNYATSWTISRTVHARVVTFRGITP